MPENGDKKDNLVVLVVMVAVISFIAGAVIGGIIHKNQVHPSTNPPVMHGTPIQTPQPQATPEPNPQNSMPTPAPSNVNLSLKRFLDGKDAAVFYFFSPGCPHCINATPYVHEVANSSEFDWVRFYFYNVEKPSQDVYLMANKYRVMAVPTVVIDGLFEKSPVVLVGEDQVRDLGNVLRDIRSSMSQEVR